MLLRLLCTFLITFSLFSDDQEEPIPISSSEHLASFIPENSHLIGGVISPFSGQPCLQQIDLVANGTQEITLSRVYIPPFTPQICDTIWKEDQRRLFIHLTKNYRGWTVLPHLILQIKFQEIHLNEQNGVTLKFLISGNTASLAPGICGITNTVQEIPSGKFDPRNIRVQLLENRNRIIVTFPDGTKREYHQPRLINSGTRLYSHLLYKETLPNGKIIRYDNNENGHLSISSLDPKERYVYASIKTHDINGNPTQFTTHSGKTTTYSYQTSSFKYHSKQKINGHNRTINQTYTTPRYLTAVSSPFFRFEKISPDGRFLLEDYSGKDYRFKCQYVGLGKYILLEKGDIQAHSRIHTLSFPVGPQDSFHPLYQINYDPVLENKKAGKTVAKNSDGTTTIYHIAPNFLLTSIEYFDAQGKLKKQINYRWFDNGWLKAIEFKDGSSITILLKTFEYDSFGNPIQETVIGDLSGQGRQEGYTVSRSYSKDNRNLLLREEREGGPVFVYTYVPNTNLISSKLTQEGEKIILREFYAYDDCLNLIRKIVDDGITADAKEISNVSERHITNYILRQQTPYLHMPEWIEEKYLENGEEKLLKKTHLTYDNDGNIAQEDIYDSNGQFAYSIFKTYNERGDILTETNPIGQTASYDYGPKGLCKFSSSFSGRLQKFMGYDAQNRLRELKEVGDDKRTLVTTYDYDVNDNLIKKVDPFGNAILYIPDPLTKKVVRTQYPSIASTNGQPLSVAISSTYDSFGFQTSRIDANGNQIIYTNNPYGSPILITYPSESDIATHSYSYYKDGKVESETDPDSLTIKYKYDILDRTRSKAYASKKGDLFAKEAFSYNSFHLQAQTDKEGNAILFKYDSAGRKIQDEFAGRTTKYVYDPLGRLSEVQKDDLIIHYKKDLLDRIEEESHTDLSNNLLYRIAYTYDSDGNRKTITRIINGQESTETFTYDPFQRLKEHKDALGYITTTSYDETHVNPLGQRVLQVSTTDSRKTTTTVTYDALDRRVKKEIFNKDNAIISSQEFIYDPHGNLILQKDHIYEGNAYKSAQITAFTYNLRNQLETTIRAVGTNQERSTYFTYTPGGKRATKTLPDKTTLSYTYYPLGYLASLTSSDGRIHHTFECNNLGHLTKASDLVQNTATLRVPDPFGNILQETLANNLVLEKTYDSHDRINSLTFPDHSTVVYTYDPVYLRKIERFSPSQELLYTHTYNMYDLSGNLLSETLPKNIGQIIHIPDLKGRPATLQSSYFTQTASYDPCDNLIYTTLNNTSITYTYDPLSQLTSENNFSYQFDSNYNLTLKNSSEAFHNELNELSSLSDTTCAHDLNGNLYLKKSPQNTTTFSYDPLNQLISAQTQNASITFTYDPFGRRLSKTVNGTTEYYLYDGQHEIGAYPYQLRILTPNTKVPTTVAMEFSGKLFIPISDMHHNIRHLQSISFPWESRFYSYTAFGEQITPPYEDSFPYNYIYHLNPWRFASKRLDPELNLIYFGKRIYDPVLGRWLTTDPAGFHDSMNLYQYAFNNPFRYTDPNGEFAFVIPLLVWGASAAGVTFTSITAAQAIAFAVTATVAWGAYEIQQHQQRIQELVDPPYYKTSDSGQADYQVKDKEGKKKQIDQQLPKDPDELLKDPKWEEISHQDAKEKGHRTFENTKTGEKLRYDKGKSGEAGNRGESHWHRYNPNSKNRQDEYLDANNRPVPRNSPESHLYPPK